MTSPIQEIFFLSPLAVWTRVGAVFGLRRLDKCWCIIVVTDAPKLRYHVVQEETLPKNPMVDRAYTIYCKASRLTVAHSAIVVFVGCNDQVRA